MQRLTIEMLSPELKLNLFELLGKEKNKREHCTFIDCRVWIEENRGVAVENGNVKDMADDYGGSFNVRVLAGHPMVAAGYEGRIFGTSDFPKLLTLISEAIESAYRQAMASGWQKELRREKWGELGKALWSCELELQYSHDPQIASVPAEYRIDPRSVSLKTITQTLKDAAEVIKEYKRIVHQVQWTDTGLVREFIVGTGGACIDQTFAITEGTIFLVGQEGAVTQEHQDVLGHQRGWEIMKEGVNEEYTQYPRYIRFAEGLADEVSTLCEAPPCPTIKDAVVVTEPHFNTLLVHEIVGHPTELDRVLKMETGYAGRSWMAKMVGKQIASNLVTAYSDPQLPGYGYYTYDHEGTLGKRVYHIEKGILKGFMSSAQTAKVFGSCSNGHWRAAGGDKVPLIRMSNTVFAPGDGNPHEIIKEVDHGYYLVGHAIPSIAESRENFRISSRRVYEIRNGELGQLYRDGSITADSKEYLMNVDAMGSNFMLYPIPNCGKGSPMQTKKLGNGGPTMRSRATLVGPTAEVQS